MAGHAAGVRPDGWRILAPPTGEAPILPQGAGTTTWYAPEPVSLRNGGISPLEMSATHRRKRGVASHASSSPSELREWTWRGAILSAIARVDAPAPILLSWDPAPLSGGMCVDAIAAACA
jgi:hypothetical protein